MTLRIVSKTKAKTYQVTFELRAVNTMTQGQFGEALKESLEDALGDSLMNLSVREGLPLGARILPQKSGAVHIQSLLERLVLIEDCLCNAVSQKNVSNDVDMAHTDLQELIADIKKAEGIE